MLTLKVNGQRHQVDRPADTPLLWVLRDDLALKGTKYGCGIGACGICTVHADGEPVRACVTAVGDVVGKRVVTIEGLAADAGSPVIEAWTAEQASQCGYCQPGQIMTAAALLKRRAPPSEAEIGALMSGVLCRCGTYQRIRRALKRAASPRQKRRAAGPAPAPAGDPASEVVLDRWIRIGAGGAVTVVVDRSEMGQGIATGLAMLAAEELEVDLDRVRIEFAPADKAHFNPAFGEQLTGGSTGMSALWNPLREAAAKVRERLVAAAATAWGVPKRECRAERGVVVHAPSRRRLGYGEIAGRALAEPTPPTVKLKPRRSFRLIGTAEPRLDLPDQLAGRTIFGSDVQIPGMLVAVVKRCPTFDGKVGKVDQRRARAVAGVREIVELDHGVAVVADNTWAALRGREALDVLWRDGKLASLSTAGIRADLAAAATQAGRVARNEGDALAALRTADTVIEAVYETPYLAHAAMEPMTCTADVGPGGCDVWAPTQAQTQAQELAARAAGLRIDQTRIHTTFLGGGFGRRLDADFVTEAVTIARKVGRPVHVLWTRDDDIRHDHYRPANYTLLRAGLDQRRQPVAWFQRVVGPELALDGVDIPYAIPNLREEHIELDPGVPTGPWRSVGASQNAFAVECFIDEIAAVAGADPLAFRKKLLRQAPRHRAVLDLAAEKAGWGTPPPRGRHRGIAAYHSYNSYVAQVAELSVGEAGAVKVHRVVAAIDCGLAVNPGLVAAQIEGAIAFGLSAALKGEITFEEGGVAQANFRDYPILTFAEMPRVEVHIMPPNGDPSGVGEPGVPPVAPAVANAIFAATGRRIRRLPIRAVDFADQ